MSLTKPLMIALSLLPFFANAGDLTIGTKDKKNHEIESTISTYINDERVLKAKTRHMLTLLEFEKTSHKYGESMEELKAEKPDPKVEAINEQKLIASQEELPPLPTANFDVLTDFYLSDLVVFGGNGQATLIYNGQELLITTDEHVNGGVLLNGLVKVTDINLYYVALKNVKTGKTARKYQQTMAFIKQDIDNKNGIKTETANNAPQKNKAIKVSYRTQAQARAEANRVN